MPEVIWPVSSPSRWASTESLGPLRAVGLLAPVVEEVEPAIAVDADDEVDREVAAGGRHGVVGGAVDGERRSIGDSVDGCGSRA